MADTSPLPPKLDDLPVNVRPAPPLPPEPTPYTPVPFAVPIQTLHSVTPGARPPAGKLVGELWVNIPDKAFGVIDATGAAIELGAGRKMVPKGYTMYVDAAGDDVAGDGTQAAPWATLARAARHCLQEIDSCGTYVYINIGPGSFAGASFAYPATRMNVNISGAGVDQTIINGVIGITANISDLGITALTIKPTLATDSCVYAVDGALLKINGPVAFDVTIGNQAIGTSQGCRLTLGGALELRQGGATYSGCVISVTDCERVSDSANWTLTGTPNTYLAFLSLDHAHYINSAGAGTGAIIGKHFVIRRGSFAHGAPLLGDQPGTWDTSSFSNGVLGVDPYTTMEDIELLIEDPPTSAVAARAPISPQPAPKAPASKPQFTRLHPPKK